MSYLCCSVIVFILNCIVFSIGDINNGIDYVIPHKTEEYSKLYKRQAAPKCTRSEYQCNTTLECISRTDLCDGVKNCKDGSDETKETCSFFECPKYSFRCQYGACVNGDAECNGKVECADASDENTKKCPGSVVERVDSTKCSTNKFKCKSGQCISQYDICDGIRNCDDGSDETEGSCKNMICPTNSFRCAYGACIDLDKRCNGEVDCADQSDESILICVQTSTPSIATRRTPTPTSPTRPVTQPTITNPPKPSTSSPPSGDSCQLPRNENGRRIQVQCSDDAVETSPVCRALQGEYVPTYTYINVTCDAGYIVEEKKDTVFLCVMGKWIPSLPACLKLCRNINPENMQLECKYGGAKIDCSGPMRPNTEVRPSCAVGYRAENPINYRYVYCRDRGEWDQTIFKCVPECGKPYVNTEALIIDGVNATHGDSPWHVAIYDLARSRELICGGTIITPYLILSAAHCFFDEKLRSMKNASNYEIAVSKYTRDYYKYDNEYQQIYTIKHLHSNQFYVGKALNYADDIAILETAVKINLSALVLPACVRWNAHHGDIGLSPGTPGKVVGWGLDNTEKASPHLLAAEMPFLPFLSCFRETAENFQTYFSSEKFCAGNKTGPSVRQGDSGGGLLFRLSNLFYIYGIVSVRFPSLSTSVAMFTSVYHHIEWINEVRRDVESRLIRQESTIDWKSV